MNKVKCDKENEKGSERIRKKKKEGRKTRIEEGNGGRQKKRKGKGRKS